MRVREKLHQRWVNHLVLMVAVKIKHTTKSQSDTILYSICFCYDSVPLLFCLHLVSLLVCFHNVHMTPSSWEWRVFISLCYLSLLSAFHVQGCALFFVQCLSCFSVWPITICLFYACDLSVIPCHPVIWPLMLTTKLFIRYVHQSA